MQQPAHGDHALLLEGQHLQRGSQRRLVSFESFTSNILARSFLVFQKNEFVEGCVNERRSPPGSAPARGCTCGGAVTCHARIVADARSKQTHVIKIERGFGFTCLRGRARRFRWGLKGALYDDDKAAQAKVNGLQI